MTEIFRSSFDSTADGFTGGAWSAAQGSAAIGSVDGALQVAAGQTAYRDFTNISTGVVRVDLWVKDPAADFPTAASASSVFYLLENGATPASASGLAVIAIDRSANTTASEANLQYRDATTFVNLIGDVTGAGGATSGFKLRRGFWYKLSFVVNIAAKTCDYYVDDILVMRGVAWPNASATQIGRIAVVAQASAPNVYLDEVVVTSDWSTGESVLIDHTFVGGSGEIEVSTPTTSLREAHPQPWSIAQDTTVYGGFLLGANGGAPDASRTCFALQRCGVNGVIECEFNTAPSGVAYFGLIFRFWDYPTSTSGGGGILRISGSDNTAIMQLPDRTGVRTTVKTASVTPTANTTYTLKLEMRGRVLIASYKAAAMDAGSYTQLWEHTVNSSATGGRGMLSEELCGPLIATTVGDVSNYVRRFRYTGAVLPCETVKTIGGYKWGISAGSVREAYATASAAPTRNLFFSKGIQYGHRSSADTNGSIQAAVIYDAPNLYATRQTGATVSEYEQLGTSDCYVTLLRRGPWISDHVLPAYKTENFAPDLDLKAELWSKDFYTVVNTGSATARSDTTPHDWAVHNSGVTLPAGNQALTAYGSGSETLLSQIVIADQGAPTAAWDVTSKYENSNDPISRAISVQGTNLTIRTPIRTARAFLVQPASALDAAVLSNWRDDSSSPASLSVSVGSANTSAAGDTNTDAFNERHGWYELTAAGGGSTFTLPVPSGSRYMPAFRISGFTPATGLRVTLNGAPAVPGVEYVVDTVAAGVHVLQLLSTRTANTTISLTDGVPYAAWDGAVTPANCAQGNASSTATVSISGGAEPPPPPPVTTSTVRRLLLREILRGVS